MEEFLCDEDYENILTPDTLAIRLLLDNKIDDSIIHPCPLDNDNNNNNNNLIIDQFHILITVYMEMVFALLKIQHVSSLTENGQYYDDKEMLEESFNESYLERLNSLSLDDLTTIFREKLRKVRIYLSVIECDPELSHDYYCKIILKDLHKDNNYTHLDNQDSNKKYVFVLRKNDNTLRKKLDDYYALCVLPNLTIRISFSLIAP